jgi:peptide/nickel transport system substrate-binding protein
MRYAVNCSFFTIYNGMIMNRPTTNIFMFFFLILFFLAPASTTKASEPKYGGIVRIGVLFPQFDHLDGRKWIPLGFVPAARMIYDPILQWGAKGFEKPQPCLATSYETKDNMEWFFRLRMGVKFHNGRDMTAEDVTANLSWRLETPKGWEPIQNRDLFRFMKKVETVDKYTVKVTLDRPFSPFPRLLAHSLSSILPPEEVKKWNKDFWKRAIGTGPYKLVDVKPNERVVVERFEDYWGPRPYIDRIEYFFIRSDRARLSALEKGEIDVVHLIDADKPALEKNPDLEYFDWPVTANLDRIWFNQRRWPMNDIRFRMAIWMGADWKDIVINSYSHQSGHYARTHLEHTKYYKPETIRLVPKYDPEEAKKLIQAVEKDEGKKIPKLRYVDANTPVTKNQAELAKTQLAKIGVTLDLKLHSEPVWTNQLQRDKKMRWDLGKQGAGFGANPFQGFAYHVSDSGTGADGKSLDGYSNPALDKWIETALRLMNEEEIAKSFQEAEKVLILDAGNIPLSPARQLSAFNKKIKGIKPNNLAAFFTTTNFENWWIEQ